MLPSPAPSLARHFEWTLTSVGPLAELLGMKNFVQKSLR